MTEPTSTRERRAVPWSTRWTVLWGGGRQLLGWCLFSFGMIFAWIFAGAANWSALVHFRGPLQEADGVITASEKTGFSVGRSGGRFRGRSQGRSHQGRQVMGHHYRFPFNGADQAGISYVTGGGPAEGRRVRIEFPQGRPGMARVKGMRRAPLGPGALLVLALPAAGLAVALTGLRRGARACGLLARGELATGRLIDRQRTNASVNKRAVYRLTFAYTDAHGQSHQMTTRTHLTKKLQDEAEERLLHDPGRPGRAVLVDELPGALHISDEGQIAPVRLKSVLAAVLPPLMAVLAVVGGALLKWG